MSQELPFLPFIKSVEQQWNLMQTAGTLVRTDVSADALWNHYMDSFPKGTNNDFRERREYDCRHCQGFIRKVGNVVAITPKGILTIWDVTTPGYHQVVADAMAALVRPAPIVDYYLGIESRVGVKASNDYHTAGLVWKHFHVAVPKQLIVKEHELATKLGELRATKDVFKRGMVDLDLSAAETVLELAGVTLHKGPEYVNALKNFVKLKTQYEAIKDPLQKEIFVWSTAQAQGPSCRFYGSVIATLVDDLSKGQDLDDAVKSFEHKVSGGNFKRTTALATPGQLKAFAKRLEDLGLKDSIYRTYATPAQISINNRIFSAQVAKPLDVIGDMLAEAHAKPPKVLKDVQEISLADFIKTIVPTAKSLELLFEGRLASNLVSLIAPMHADVPKFFKWNNNFSWAYKGDVADSLRERVVALGGRVDGVLRFSHTWNYDPTRPNQSLMDLHLFMPGWKAPAVAKDAKIETHNQYGKGRRIGWNNRKDIASGGSQDLDFVNEPGKEVPVENITFPSISKMPEGKYVFKIHNWNLRQPTKSGFRAEIEFGGQVYKYEYADALKHHEWITLAEVTLKNGVFTIEHKLDSSKSSVKIWNVNTETFVPVSMITKSPNFWDGQTIGHEHTFFIMNDCKSDEPARGFFNEYLMDTLTPDRKAFEMLGGRTKAEPTDNQVSGLGFSATKRESLTVRVTGKTVRTFIIKF